MDLTDSNRDVVVFLGVSPFAIGHVCPRSSKRIGNRSRDLPVEHSFLRPSPPSDIDKVIKMGSRWEQLRKIEKTRLVVKSIETLPRDSVRMIFKIASQKGQ